MADVVSMPKLGFDMAEGTLVRWVKLEGETVNKGDILAEIETDKATVEVESSFAGVVHQHLVEQGSVVPVGTPIAIIAAPGEQVEDIPTTQPAQEVPAQAQTPQTDPAAPVQPAATPTAPAGPVKASPLARRMATEQGLDIHTLRGSGPGGRIVKRDVESALKSIPASFPLKPATPPAQMTSTAIPGDETVPVDRLRAAIGRRMVESKQQVPHFYVTHACRVDELMSLRKKINSTLPEGEKISVTDFLIKAAGLALRRYPHLNASLNGDVSLRHGDVNVGVAVAVPGGLLTVVNRNTDQKPLRVISREVREMVIRARDGKVRPDDIEGSTFSISNLGMFDVDSFVAIINPPEAAILAVGSVQEVPVVEDGQIKPGMVLKITLSADHRITDGAEAAQFLQAMAEYLENPLLMLI